MTPGVLRYPWESAATGAEVCPEFAADVRDYQHHITGDISYAMRQYLATTGDTNILHDTVNSNTGCQFVREMAEFWVSRMSYNAATGQYDIRGVMGPDEYHANVTNNVYTNIIAAMAVNFANLTHCAAHCDQIPQDWVDMARMLSLQYDPQLDYHPQFEGYAPGTVIKQADTVLAGYPLMYPMNASTRLHDLEMYEAVTDPGGPAMTWGMFAVGYLELGDTARAEELFKRSYQPYYHPPFYMWTENVNGTGAINFLTGMGGFLQGVMFGYFGVRTKLDRMEFNPVLPPNTTSMKMTGVDYYGNDFDIEVEDDAVVIDFKTTMNELVLVLMEGHFLTISSPQQIVIGRKPFFLGPNIDNFLSRCTLPDDTIGH